MPACSAFSKYWKGSVLVNALDCKRDRGTSLIHKRHLPLLSRPPFRLNNSILLLANQPLRLDFLFYFGFDAFCLFRECLTPGCSKLFTLWFGSDVFIQLFIGEIKLHLSLISQPLFQVRLLFRDRQRFDDVGVKAFTWGFEANVLLDSLKILYLQRLLVVRWLESPISLMQDVLERLRHARLEQRHLLGVRYNALLILYSLLHWTSKLLANVPSATNPAVGADFLICDKVYAL